MKKKIEIVLGLYILTLFLCSCSGKSTEYDWADGATLINSTGITEEKQSEISTDSRNEESQDSSNSNDYQESANGRTLSISDYSIYADAQKVINYGGMFYMCIEELSNLIPNTIIEEDKENETVLSWPVYYFDDNALLCIQVKITFSEKGAATLQKSYFYPQDTLYNLEEDASEYFKVSSEKVYVCLNELLPKLGFTVLFSGEKLIISGGAIASENKKNTDIYEPVRLDKEQGFIWSTLGTRMKDEYLGQDYKGRFSATPIEKPVIVSPGQKIKLTFYSSWFSEVATLYYTNDEDQIVSYYCTNRSTYLEQEIFTVPQGATKLYFTYWAGQKYQVFKEVIYIGVDLSTITDEEYMAEMNRVLVANQEKSLKNHKSIVPSEKGRITFVVDDTRYDLPQIIDLFEEYGFPLCAATIHENIMGAGCEDVSDTNYGALHKMVANGGEILSHSAEVITVDNIDNQQVLFKHFFETKYMLGLYGFDVDGIILAGGQGQICGDERTDIFARTYYEYSDLYGTVEPYLHGRIWLGGIVGKYTDVIDDVIANKSWGIYYLHGLDEVSESDLRSILDYLSSNRDRIDVVTYRDVYR